MIILLVHYFCRQKNKLRIKRYASKQKKKKKKHQRNKICTTGLNSKSNLVKIQRCSTNQLTKKIKLNVNYYFMLFNFKMTEILTKKQNKKKNQNIFFF